MRNKEYRELQLSSSSLIFIFLGFILVGIIIFLLGVSVGKKQVQLVQATELEPTETIQRVVEQKGTPTQEPKDPISQEIASHKKQLPESKPQAEMPKAAPAKKPVQKTAPPPPSAKPQSGGEGRFFIQVGAYRARTGANDYAERLRKMGYPVVVVDPSPSSRSQLYRVRVGGYATRDLAEQEKAKLAQAEKKNESEYFIVEL